MSPLMKIRAERDQMSAIERRIADFILTDAHLLRDYSSQQLANALGISQSSVVKFSQKLGFRGYPDLKYSIGEELARTSSESSNGNAESTTSDTPSEQLWRIKTAAREETDLVNTEECCEDVTRALDAAQRILVFGQGEDGLHAHLFTHRITQLGLPAFAQTDCALILPSLLSLARNDVLFVLSEHGSQPELSAILRTARAAGSKIISVTRHTSNLLRSYADFQLLVSAHASEPHIESMAFRSAMQQLLDGIVLRLIQADRRRREHFYRTRERLQHPDILED